MNFCSFLHQGNWLNLCDNYCLYTCLYLLLKVVGIKVTS